MIEKIFKFNVNNETLAFMKYKAKRRIFTIKAEQRYYMEQISNLKNVLMEVQAGLSVEVKNSYKEVVYIERRAEYKIFTLFENNKIICNIIAICFGVIQIVK